MRNITGKSIASLINTANSIMKDYVKISSKNVFAVDISIYLNGKACYLILY